MTSAEAFEFACGRLAGCGEENPAAVVRMLFEYLLNISPTDMAVCPEAEVPSDEVAALAAALERRAQGEPVQYICGKAPFRFADLECERGVFIPRPETEVLVGCAIDAVQVASDEARALEDAAPLLADEPQIPDAAPLPDAPPLPAVAVADLCCGTGAIAVSLASECPSVRVDAVDVSLQAVALAGRNARLLGVDDRVRVHQGDLFSPLSGGVFHVVVSNPPYIPTSKIAAMPREVVDWEPMAALDGGEDGLDVFKRIVRGCADHLAPGGFLVCELDEDTLEQAAAVCEASGQAASHGMRQAPRNEAAGATFRDIEIVKDLAGRNRILKARRER